MEAEQVSQAVEQAKSEGERLVKLTKDEREAAEAKRIAELVKSARAGYFWAWNEVSGTIVSADEGLPQEFSLGHVLAPTAEEVKAKIMVFRDVFDSEVEKARKTNIIVQSAPSS